MKVSSLTLRMKLEYLVSLPKSSTNALSQEILLEFGKGSSGFSPRHISAVTLHRRGLSLSAISQQKLKMGAAITGIGYKITSKQRIKTIRREH